MNSIYYKNDKLPLDYFLNNSIKFFKKKILNSKSKDEIIILITKHYTNSYNVINDIIYWNDLYKHPANKISNYIYAYHFPEIFPFTGTLDGNCDINEYPKYIQYEYGYEKDLYQTYDHGDKIYTLEYLRDNALGIGTRKLKIRMNNYIKSHSDDNYIKLLRIFLEIEDVNIMAKKYYYKYKTAYYEKKASLLSDAIDMIVSNNMDIVWGKQKSDHISHPWILYFELRDGKQISWHVDTNYVKQITQKYDGVWDGVGNSTLDKILSEIKSLNIISLEK